MLLHQVGRGDTSGSDAALQEVVGGFPVDVINGSASEVAARDVDGRTVLDRSIQ